MYLSHILRNLEIIRQIHIYSKISITSRKTELLLVCIFRMNHARTFLLVPFDRDGIRHRDGDVILTTKSQQAFNLSCTFCIEKTRIPHYRNIQVHEWNPSAISTRFQIVCVSVGNAFNYRLSGVPILCEATDNIVPS